MKTLLVRHRKLGYTTTICPFDEDYKHWYVIETRGKKMVDTRRYSKIDFDLMGEK
jgi:hypothetical protein